MSTNIKISALPTKNRVASGDFVPIVDNDGTPTTKKVTGDAFIPVGSYITHAGASAPTGYLACNGAAVSRSTYADLFAVISTTYGVGDGSTTFNLPDARGLVMVGAGAHGTMTRANGTAYNGGTVGASRNDQAQGHYHGLGLDSNPNFGRVIGSYMGGGSIVNSTLDAGPDGRAFGGTMKTDGTNGTPRTGDETRPAEIAVLVCIKY